MNRKQSGMTMLGFLITLAVVMFFLYCGMKIVPMYTEVYSVKKALASIANEQNAQITSKDKIRALFARHMQIDYVSVIKPEMLKIESTDTGYNMLMDYERRTPLFANLDVVAKVHAEHSIAGFQPGIVDCFVRRDAGVRLYICVVCTEEFFGTVYGKLFEWVGKVLAAVVAFARVAFAIFIGKNAAIGFQHCGTDVVFTRDEFQPIVFAFVL